MALPLDESALETMQSPKAQPRVSFGQLVENGYIRAGAQITDKKRRFGAIVRADGSLKWTDKYGSIHKIGAMVQNAPSCNGWMFWYYQTRNGELKVIDELRQTYLLANEP